MSVSCFFSKRLKNCAAWCHGKKICSDWLCQVKIKNDEEKYEKLFCHTPCISLWTKMYNGGVVSAYEKDLQWRHGLGTGQWKKWWFAFKQLHERETDKRGKKLKKLRQLQNKQDPQKARRSFLLIRHASNTSSCQTWTKGVKFVPAVHRSFRFASLQGRICSGHTFDPSTPLLDLGVWLQSQSWWKTTALVIWSTRPSTEITILSKGQHGRRLFKSLNLFLAS